MNDETATCSLGERRKEIVVVEGKSEVMPGCSQPSSESEMMTSSSLTGCSIARIAGLRLIDGSLKSSSELSQRSNEASAADDQQDSP